MITKYPLLDVVPGGEPQKFHISKFDKNSRTLQFRLFASSGELDIPSGTTASLEGRKPDMSELKVSASLNGYLVTVTLPESAADKAGYVPCNIILKNGNKRLYSELFILVVDKPAKEDDDV